MDLYESLLLVLVIVVILGCIRQLVIASRHVKADAIRRQQQETGES